MRWLVVWSTESAPRFVPALPGLGLIEKRSSPPSRTVLLTAGPSALKHPGQPTLIVTQMDPTTFDVYLLFVAISSDEALINAINRWK
jgi:hypothetical protein